MPRLMFSRIPQLSQHAPVRSFVAARRNFAETSASESGTQNSRPGWKGRHGDDHVLHRDGNDSQSEASLQAREEREKGQGESQGISQKDVRNSNKKAKEDHPEAPEPVIGMNSERGSKGS